MITAYNYKLIQSGNMLETYDFKIPIYQGFTVKKSSSSACIRIPEDEAESDLLQTCERNYRLEHLNRQRRNIKRVAYCNFDNRYTTLITFTYKKNIISLKEANHDLNLFMKRLKYVLEKYKYPYEGFQLKYICKPEFQERGSIHFHCATNLRYFPYARKNAWEWIRRGILPSNWDSDYNLQSIWSGKTEGKGTADHAPIRETDRMIDVISYLTNYMVKQFEDERFSKEKAFWTTRNLEKPLIYYGDKAIQRLETLSKNRDIKKVASPEPFTPMSYPQQEILYRSYILS